MCNPGEGTRVKTPVTYCLPPEDGDVYAVFSDRKFEGKFSNFAGRNHEVVVEDVRHRQEDFNLHRDGFQLEGFHVPSDIDWQSKDEVESKYHKEAEILIKRCTGATRVHTFMTTLRTGPIMTGPDTEEMRKTAFAEPIPRVHNDIALNYGVEHVKRVLPEEAETLVKTPFAVIQVWRPLKGPVVESPLAFVHPSSVDKADLIPYNAELRDHVATAYLLKHNPGHKFLYVKHITTEEAFVFKCYDSRKDEVRWTPHCSFKDPTTPPDAPRRESIELRAYAFFEDQPEQAVSMEL